MRRFKLTGSGGWLGIVPSDEGVYVKFDDYRAEMASKNLEITNFQVNLEQANQDNDNTTNMAAGISLANFCLTANLRERIKELATSELMVHTLEGQVNGLMEIIQSSSDQVYAMSQEIKELKEVNGNQYRAIGNYQEVNAELVAEVNSLDDRNTKQFGAIIRFREGVDELTKEIKSLEGQLKASEERTEYAQRERDRFKNRVDELEYRNRLIKEVMVD